MHIQKQTLCLALSGLLLGISVGMAPSLNVTAYMGGTGFGRDSSYGTVSSIQTDQASNSPTWVLSGHWATNIVNKTKEDFNQTSPAKFDASFSMVMLNGSARHTHSISNSSLIDVKDENRTVSYSGLSTVTLKAGPAKDVPTEIKIFNNNAISMWFDPVKVNHHFGESPIYGVVLDKKDMGKGPMSQIGDKMRSW
jgi:hypothetical protein